METKPLNPEAENVAIVQFVPVRDDTKFHYSGGEEDRVIVDDFCAGLLLQIEVTDVVNGQLTPEGDFATLVLITNRFLGFTSQRRFREVELIITFHDAKKNSFYDPEVVKHWPDGEYTYRESSVQVEDTKAVSATAAAGYAGANASITTNWERKTSTNQVGRARMTGAAWKGQNSMTRNAVRVFIQENASQKDGIVSEVQLAVLLRQKGQDRELSAQVQITAEAGQWFRAEWKYRGLDGKRTIGSSAFSCRTTAKSAKVKDQHLQDEDLGGLSGVPTQKKIADA